jgi:hypothetical protein
MFADPGNTFGHVPQRERPQADLAAFDLSTCTAPTPAHRLRPHGVGRGNVAL